MRARARRVAGRWMHVAGGSAHLAAAMNLGFGLVGGAAFAAAWPEAHWNHAVLVAALALINVTAFFTQVDLKLNSAAYFGADLFLAVLVLALAGPLPALVVWLIPEFLARYVMRRDPMLSPGLVATVTSYLFAVLAGQAILSAAAPATASAAAPALYTAGLAMCLVNFVFARLVFAPFYQGLRPDTLVRTEFFGLAPLVLGMLLLAVATWLLIPHLGVFALVPLTVVVIGPQLAFRHLSRRRSVASMERLDAERLYAQAIGDLMGLPRERRRALACASELAAGRYRRWRIEDAMRYSNADLSGAIPIALHAEERWDGAGDPAGLEGAQAPVESRILGVARRWSDLTARGTPELPHSEALLGLAALSGSELDPGIVAAAQRVVAQEEIFVGVPDFEPRLHRLPLPRSARRGAVPALLGKLAAAD